MLYSKSIQYSFNYYLFQRVFFQHRCHQRPLVHHFQAVLLAENQGLLEFRSFPHRAYHMYLVRAEYRENVRVNIWLVGTVFDRKFMCFFPMSKLCFSVSCSALASKARTMNVSIRLFFTLTACNVISWPGRTYSFWTTSHNRCSYNNAPFSTPMVRWKKNRG